MNNLEFITKTFETSGTLLIAYAALKVHYRVKQEHKIDNRVLSEMNMEFKLGVLGSALVVVGYFLTVLTY